MLSAEEFISAITNIGAKKIQVEIGSIGTSDRHRRSQNGLYISAYSITLSLYLQL